MENVDAKLVARCIEGDEVAWEIIVRKYSRRIYNLAYRYGGRHDHAEDLTQEIFLRLYQTLRSYDPRAGSFEGWMLRLARNLIIDKLRQERKQRKVAGSDELEKLDFVQDEAEQPLAALERAQQTALLRAALDKLSPELRESVILRDIEGMSYREIADLVGVPEGTVKSRINRGRLELARLLRPKLGEQRN